ncbi:ABC transporter permease [Fontivita pretiosa]|uniref:ABC transporter permease n=1 Tax=Fontivita pretiosa TaxID=2989684 RepID=UPI003D17C066
MKLLLRMVKQPETMTFVLLLVALGVGSSMSPYFLDAEYLLDKTSSYIPVGFMALAMTFVIIAAQIDLSVASGSLLTAVISAWVYSRGVPMPFVMVLALLIGLGLGLFNGVLVAYLKLPSLVVTLGTLALYRGLAQGWIGDGRISGFPQWFVGIDYVKLGIVPLPLIILLIIAAALALILTRSTFGRKVFALGTNESATRYSAIDVARVKLGVFALSGLSMGAAALVQMSQIRTIDQKQFRSDELLAITAVVLGGSSIFGGRGSILGTVLALLLLVVVRSAMGVANVRVENQLAIIGSMLVASVLLSDIFSRINLRAPKPIGIDPGASNA